MTEHDDKQVASVDAMANAEPSKGRRRFFKTAALTAPAVMTLCNGRLAMAASLCTDAERIGSTVDYQTLPFVTKNPNFAYEYKSVSITIIKNAQNQEIYYLFNGKYYDPSSGMETSYIDDPSYINENGSAFKLITRRIDGDKVAFTQSCWTSFSNAP